MQNVLTAQKANKRICGSAYNYKYDGYVFVDELGELLKPNYISGQFPKLSEKNKLRRIRYHDL